jgi:hypothetical protein
MAYATDTTIDPGARVTDGDTAATARPAQSLDERYGRRPRGGPGRSRRARVLLAAAGGLVAALALGWGAWVSYHVTDKPVTWQDVGFDVVADDVTRVTFDVRFANDVPAGGEAVCTLRALSRSMAEVGLTDVRVGPASRRDLRVSAEIPTSERAVTGMVKECAVVGG